MTPTLIAIVVAAGIATLLGLIIGFAAKIFAVETDERVEEVIELLPGANCGGCGFAGCSDFAKAVVDEKAPPSACPVNSQDMTVKIAEYLGLDADAAERQVAIVKCGGDKDVASRAQYNGVADCVAASLVAGGAKDCQYGCLGMASCSNVCPFDAIEMRNGLAIVHPELCVGCGKCVETCPRNLIELVPASAETHIFCSSPDKGPVKRKYCKVACIGCRKCVKASEEGQITMNGFLAVVNYDNPPAKDVIEAAQCPANCIKSHVDDEPIKKEAK